ncbi:sulfatase-like hydrolase/transferase [Paraburkholderia sp. CNPSo 3157]|uniref:Sulfatase-like hydrolase/transferase n=1 Tax=Paraburkholderia franconis TaxID=2654983 RepID=A0A7X1TJ16_9BURK|nr:sulfatase-like hydrolase/transferase [Paraburkholderia franconis]MPW20819.1 sulfatase-like hydrolase/transferase [Paraburkholderia franconis]
MMIPVWFIAALWGALWATQAVAASTITEPTRVTGRPGYNQPNQYLTGQTVKLADNMEPVINNPDQAAEARQKLSALQKRAGKRPNVVIFLLDDVGYSDFGFNGGGPAVGNDTQDVDRIASQSLILSSAYSQPSCSPTRATIMTGENMAHHGIQIPVMYGQPGGLAGMTTLAALMSRQGYTTQAVGKWHMGENTASLPQNVGFDDFRGFLSVSDMYTEWRDPQYNPEVALSPERYNYILNLPFNKSDVHAAKGGQLENLYEINADNIKDLDQKWLDYTVGFLNRQKDATKPFFLYYAPRACHYDNYPSDYYRGRSAAHTNYGDCVVEVNDIFRKLVDTLQANGELDNTIIFFGSDNGPEQEIQPAAKTMFRGGKGSTWEGGVRSPFFVYWKGMIAPRRSDGLFDFADMFNTSLSLAGLPGADLAKAIPSTTYIDGIDQTSFLLADKGVSNRKSIFYFWNDEVSAVRVDEFKMMFKAQLPDSVNRMGYNGGFAGTVGQAWTAMVFNLYSDPKEEESVLARHTPLEVFLLAEYRRYLAVLKKYPPRHQLSVK